MHTGTEVLPYGVAFQQRTFVHLCALPGGHLPGFGSCPPPTACIAVPVSFTCVQSFLLRVFLGGLLLCHTRMCKPPVLLEYMLKCVFNPHDSIVCLSISSQLLFEQRL